VEDLLFTAVALLAGMVVHQLVLRRHPLAFEQKLLTRSFVLHMASAIGLILVYQYYYGGGGDMFAYLRYGVPITEALRSDFERVAPQLWALFVHSEYSLPIDTLGLGSTGTMQAVACVLFYLLNNSLYASAVAISIGSYLAKVSIFSAIRPEFPPADHERVMFSALLSPTAIVWTCALLKEPVLMVFLGPAFLALRWLLDGRRLPQAMLILGVCGWVIALIKPYVLIAFALGAGAWIFGRVIKARGNLLVKPVYVLGAGVAVALGFAVASSVLPGLSPDRVADTVQYQRRASSREVGGSNFYLEDADAPLDEVPERGVVSQLSLVPLALLTALFRPVLFESFSALQFLNSIEMAWLTLLFVQVVRRNSWTALVQRVLANPALLFSATFVLVLALGTGLATANLGTLSRYRAPMMPFFLLLLLTLREGERLPRGVLVPEREPSPGLS
jgi:hypothetical protein